MKCPVCGVRDPEVGVLCEECRDELSSPIRITPEQIILRIVRPTDAALLDPWGRVHLLEARTIVGRQIDSQGLAILEPSVSRHHAHLTLDNGVWTLRDLGSANGTFHNDQLIETAVPVASGDRIRFGHIAFYILSSIDKLPVPRATRTVTSTIKPPNIPIDLPPIANKPEFGEEEENTNVGLPEMRFQMHEPTGGGGGLIEVDGKQVQLTTTQFELMALMIRRMAAEEHQPELVRGFVRSSELIADLSWDTREPSENHVKQLVRRVRRALIKSDIGDLIESRHRFGYRLRAIPKTE
jgi:pSer/pThr/pTyr-binding forkhead associated (FHA) protein